MIKTATALALLGLLAWATPTLAQGPPPGGPGNQGGPGGPGNPGGAMIPPPPELVLKEALGFSDMQLAAFQTLMRTRGETIQALQAQIAEAEKALMDAVHDTEPNPTNVGTLFLAVDALRNKVGDADGAFRTGFAALLTEEQKTRLQDMLNLQAAVQAGEALRRLGL